MTQTSAPETVARLKELLFERETSELTALARRIGELQQRAGSEEQFRRSVALVLDRALRDAEETRHKELSDAMAPMVLRTLRTEMNSAQMQDQIAGLMFPRIGEMVSKYVASAFRDMMNEINRRLESGVAQNGLVLRLRSLVSGRSMAELALADTQQLEVREIYLVQRGSGIPLHHWQRDADDGGSRERGNRDTLVSGLLAAIMSFAEDAFEADKESLRTLDLDDHRIFIRGSPDTLLAVKCRGTAPAGIDQMLDGELIRVLDEDRATGGTSDGRDPGTTEASAATAATRQLLLGGLADRIETAASERTRQASSQHGGRMVKTLLWLVGLPLLALAGWYGYVSWITYDLQSRADAELKSIPALTGYPVRAHVERGGRRVWITGLAPDLETRAQAIGRIKAVAPEAELSEAVGVLPQSDVVATVDAVALRQAIERARRQISVLVADLDAKRDRADGSPERPALVSLEALARSTLADLDKAGDGLEGRLLAAADALVAQGRRLAELAGVDPPQAGPRPRTAGEAAEAIAVAANRIGTLVAALEQRRQIDPITRRIEAVGAEAAQRATATEQSAAERLAALNRQLEARIAALERQLANARPAPTTPRQRLEAFVKANAVFFGNDTVYRNTAAAERFFGEAVALIQASDLLIRVVGYTDEVGTSARNAPLSQARADRVAAELVQRGVPAERLIAVGRPVGINLAPGAGSNSPNRRVELEIAFADERGSAP